MEEKQQNKQEEIEKRKRNFCKKGKFYILYFHGCDTAFFRERSHWLLWHTGRGSTCRAEVGAVNQFTAFL